MVAVPMHICGMCLDCVYSVWVPMYTLRRAYTACLCNCVCVDDSHVIDMWLPCVYGVLGACVHTYMEHILHVGGNQWLICA